MADTLVYFSESRPRPFVNIQAIRYLLNTNPPIADARVMQVFSQSCFVHYHSWSRPHCLGEFIREIGRQLVDHTLSLFGH